MKPLILLCLIVLFASCEKVYLGTSRPQGWFVNQTQYWAKWDFHTFPNDATVEPKGCVSANLWYNYPDGRTICLFDERCVVYVYEENPATSCNPVYYYITYCVKYNYVDTALFIPYQEN